MREFFLPMALATLPDLVYPVTRAQTAALMSGIAQLNLIYAGMDERSQKALAILFKIFQLKASPGGSVDYTGPQGHAKLYQDSESLVGEGTGISTRVGDLRAAGLAIDYSDTVAKLRLADLPPIPNEVTKLRDLCRDFASLPPRKLDEISLLLSYVRKESFNLDRPASDPD